MIRRIIGPLPPWAQRTHPMLTYQLKRVTTTSRAGRLARAFLVVLGIFVLGLGGYAAATNVFTQPAGMNLTIATAGVLFYPVIVLNLAVVVAALGYTVGVVGDERRSLTWDNLRATPVGAEMTLRTRWASVFYRLRAVLVLITLIRLFQIFRVLFDLTALNGRYIDIIMGGVVPTIPQMLGPVPLAPMVGALLESLFLTAALLLPFTTIAFDAAVGLLLSAVLQQRVYALLLQFTLVIVRVAAVFGLTWLFLQNFGTISGASSGQLISGLEVWQSWLLLFGFSAFVDWGTQLLNFQFAAEVWQIVPYSLFVGPALLVLVLLQAFFAERILNWAIRIGERRG